MVKVWCLQFLISEDRAWYGKTWRIGRKEHHLLEKQIAQDIRDLTEEDLKAHHYSHHNLSDHETLKRKLTFSLEDAIKRTKSQAKKAKPKTKKRKSSDNQLFSDKKRQMILINDEPTTADNPSSAETTTSIPSKWFEPYPGPIAISLPISEIQRDYLEEQFGSLYQDGGTFPRSFVIEITDKLREALQDDDYYKPHCMTFDLEAYLTFMLVKMPDDGQAEDATVK